MNDKTAPGEAQFTPDIVQKLAPDIISPEGQDKIRSHKVNAILAQLSLKPLLEDIAKSVGATVESRIKDDPVIGQKIAQKRLEGRPYGLHDINDMLGLRIIVPDVKVIPDVIKMLQASEKDGKFQILDKQLVADGTYKATHLDIQKHLPHGEMVNAEIQIMTNQELGNAAFDHDIRYVYGENPPKQLNHMRDDAKKVIDHLPNHKAKQFADSVIKERKANNDQPLPPITVVKNLAQAAT